MSKEAVDEILAHYGVKGMRWGTRKASSRAQTTYKKAPNRLSNEELAKRIKRLETERKYNSLNSNVKGKGRELTEDILASSGRRIATTVVTNAGMLAVGALVASRFGEGAGSSVIRKLK